MFSWRFVFKPGFFHNASIHQQVEAVIGTEALHVLLCTQTSWNPKSLLAFVGNDVK